MIVNEAEECFSSNNVSIQSRLEPRGGPPKKSGVTTSSLDRVTVFLIGYQIF
jgi:hypothetical protein